MLLICNDPYFILLFDIFNFINICLIISILLYKIILKYKENCNYKKWTPSTKYFFYYKIPIRKLAQIKLL